MKAAIAPVARPDARHLPSHRSRVGSEKYRALCTRHGDPGLQDNLIVNAIQAMSGDGDSRRELQISTETDEAEGVRIAVRDTGRGLAPESLSRLFEPFYTTKAEGMGMGLAICRSIVEAHGGRLWATTCEPHGTLFQFTIPAEQAATS